MCMSIEMAFRMVSEMEFYNTPFIYELSNLRSDEDVLTLTSAWYTSTAKRWRENNYIYWIYWLESLLQHNMKGGTRIVESKFPK